MRALFIAFGLAIASLAGCAGVEQPTGSIEESLAGGCRILCPKCHPGEVCPMIACYEDCAPPPPKCVDTMMCPIGYEWSSHACSCVPTHN